ncbi:MAG: hypothetical protein L7F77_14520 [Candidatus Magnetominusculus sp. LBB02]|nr:hypothetical protein [Candidatus Magnetominusculus sp. LBB02]
MRRKVVISAVIVLALPLIPLLLPIALVYLLAAVNMSKGYGRMFCGGVKPTTREVIIEAMESKGVPIPLWLKTKQKSC